MYDDLFPDMKDSRSVYLKRISNGSIIRTLYSNSGNIKSVNINGDTAVLMCENGSEVYRISSGALIRKGR